ncbi:alpha/beta hydrolase [Streptomyces sp. NPDC019937]|uniref:alpha/beta fold hydrolase n=1 Tax=Streptomyces sp. NPDC019937 TaxID=3154787 RepID=UPI00340C40C7
MPDPTIPTSGLTVGVPPVVATHSWQGFHCESRLVRTDSPYVAPVVLVGGAFQTKESWGRVEAEFLAHADVFTVDLPGWGQADVLPEEHGVESLADALDHMLDEVGLDVVNVVGGSYGTAIAYTFAQRHPDRVRRMALVGTMTSIPDHAETAIRRAMELLPAGRMEDFADTVLNLLFNPRTIDSVTGGARLREGMRRRLLALRPQEGAQALANTVRLLVHKSLDTSIAPPMPVLVVTGEHDHFTTPDLCREVATTCVDSWFTTITDADHMVPFERSAEIVDLLTRFFADQPLTGLSYCCDATRMSTALAASPR